MERGDDFQKRRAHLKNINDRELKQRFWELVDRIVDPLVEEARSYTSPSIERSVLLRMGFSGPEAKTLANLALEKGLLGHGVGALVLKAAHRNNLGIRETGLSMIQGNYWNYAMIAQNLVIKARSLKSIVTGGNPRGMTGGNPFRAVEDGTCQYWYCYGKLDPDKKIDIKAILKDLEHYRPRRSGWTWRKKAEGKESQAGPFNLKDTTLPLKKSVPLPSAHFFSNIDPQCDYVITTEIASGRFEDDIRRMRMAAWHGADHIMVIRTAGQSHFDGLIEGTPEGVGGVPISRKQLRASRKALDLIEDEVGRPINFHSYISGVAGPEIAVLFAEEGVNGAHQDPQYNILYRNINMHRSFVDAAEAKKIMSNAGILQIDGAHNANATAKEAWKVLPELFVQHAVNCAFSLAAGMSTDSIALSTVPPTAPPAPKLALDLPYAVALRDFFSGFKFRAQQNTRYMESDTGEATVTHVLDTLISKLTSADIQSTITPDEGRNVPWHYNNILGVNTARQTLMGLDGMNEFVCLKNEGPLAPCVREIKERAVLFLEEILEIRGYFAAVEQGYFYPLQT
jgi:D-ornithine 4,5-aminomutase subunit beta